MRASDAELDALLRRLLRAHIAPGLDPPANYSVKLAPPVARGPAGFHFLYRGSASVLRTRDAHRLLRGLLSHVASHRGPGPEEAGRLRVHAVTLVADRSAVLAPAPLRQLLPWMERGLNRRGMRVVDAPFVLVDPDTVEVMVPQADLEVDWSALAELPRLAPGSKRDPVVAAGRYPLVVWSFLAGTDGDLSPAKAVALANRLTSWPVAAQARLDALAAVFRRVAAARLPWGDARQMVDPLTRLA